jgi:hypothetical protein
MADGNVKPKTLRHNLSCLWPSEISEQFYCEYKVHLKRLHLEVKIELPVLESGTINHAALTSQAEPTTAAAIEESIREGKKLAVCEWVLEGSFQGVSLRGRPDFFAFEGKKAQLLLEFKFTKGKKPFRDQEVQAELYALLTGCMGFSTEGLCFGVVMFPSESLSGGLSKAASTKAAALRCLDEDGTLQKIAEQCEQARGRLLAGRAKRTTVESANWKAFLIGYDADRAAKDLGWALGYWLAERDATPVRESKWDAWPRKCFACPMNAAGLCEHAMQKTDPAFKVRRDGEGGIFVYR